MPKGKPKKTSTKNKNPHHYLKIVGFSFGIFAFVITVLTSTYIYTLKQPDVLAVVDGPTPNPCLKARLGTGGYCGGNFGASGPSHIRYYCYGICDGKHLGQCKTARTDYIDKKKNDRVTEVCDRCMYNPSGSDYCLQDTTSNKKAPPTYTQTYSSSQEYGTTMPGTPAVKNLSASTWCVGNTYHTSIKWTTSAYVQGQKTTIGISKGDISVWQYRTTGKSIGYIDSKGSPGQQLLITAVPLATSNQTHIIPGQTRITYPRCNIR